MKIMIQKGIPWCRQCVNSDPGTVFLILHVPRKNESEQGSGEIK